MNKGKLTESDKTYEGELFGNMRQGYGEESDKDSVYKGFW
jgi:hypothetical protein